MIVLILKDGLGNQLFQYAAAKSLANKLNTDLKLDISYYRLNTVRTYSLHRFSISERFVTGGERFFFKIKNTGSTTLRKMGFASRTYRYYEKDFSFNPSFFSLKDNTWIEGYWQSEKYFLPIKDIIRDEFVIRSAPEGVNESFLKKIHSVNSVSLHVRRGDYVSDKKISSIHGICSLDYYQSAINQLIQKVQSPHFFIFSDDMEWVKQNLIIKDHPVEYMGHNGDKDYEDLRLMYSCKHNIIANSSFSWWGAWLNRNPAKIVIAPAKWTQKDYHNSDLIPSEWLKIDA